MTEEHEYERTWSARSDVIKAADVIQAAIAYEEAWAEYRAPGPRSVAMNVHLMALVAQCRETLLQAVRALKEHP